MFKITYKFVFWIVQLSEKRKLSAGIMLNILLQKKDMAGIIKLNLGTFWRTCNIIFL